MFKNIEILRQYWKFLENYYDIHRNSLGFFVNS